MNASNGPPTGSARSVVREIDRELSRLDRLEKAVASERELLLSARAALTADGRAGLRQPVPHSELAAYLREHPGCSADRIAEALQATATSVSMHLYRGRHTRYESRDDGWYLRSRPS
jgi:hypothetical protein